MDIYEDEKFFIDHKKINNKYYIGKYFIYETYNNYNTYNDYDKYNENDPYIILLASTISCYSFFKYNINIVEKYLYEMALNISNNNVHILKIDIRNNIYKVIVKTYWLKLIQKHFKKAYQLMKKFIINNLYMYQINKYNIKKINCIKGLLYIYKKYK